MIEEYYTFARIIVNASKRHIMNQARKRKTEAVNKGVLLTNVMAQLNYLFRSKDWKIDSSRAGSIYMRFSRTLAKLSVSEQLFLLDISRRFDYIPSVYYQKELDTPINELLKHSAGKLIFVSCLSEEDAKSREIKSSVAFLYQFKGTTMRVNYDINDSTHYANVKKITEDDIQAINANEATLVLVDDFIGSGDTAYDALVYLQKTQPKLTNWKNVCFLCVASLKEGKKNIEEGGFKVYASKVYPKGISEYYRGKALEESTKQMTNIESKIHVPEYLHFGYKQSEALVCMERCPNNTFPIYWRGLDDAPFVR